MAGRGPRCRVGARGGARRTAGRVTGSTSARARGAALRHARDPDRFGDRADVLRPRRCRGDRTVAPGRPLPPRRHAAVPPRRGREHTLDALGRVRLGRRRRLAVRLSRRPPIGEWIGVAPTATWQGCRRRAHDVAAAQAGWWPSECDGRRTGQCARTSWWFGCSETPRCGRARHRCRRSSQPGSDHCSAILVVARDRPISRARLAFDFWPDSTDGQARTNLRQALHHLRHALGDADRYVRVDGTSVQWLIDSPAVRRRRDVRGGGRGRPGRRRRGCAGAGAPTAYRGDLLAGCYDDWLDAGTRAPALARRPTCCHARRPRPPRGVTGPAPSADSRPARCGSTRSTRPRHRLAIEAHAAAGDRVRALRRYHECVTVLDRELGVAPAPATVALYDALVAGRPADTDRARAAAGRRAPPADRP